MTRLGTVIETVGSFAGFAAEWEEVELVAVIILAVRAYSVEIFVHGREGLRFRWWWEGGCGSHDGRFVEISNGYAVAAVSGSVGSSACGHGLADGAFGKRSLECTRRRY